MTMGAGDGWTVGLNVVGGILVLAGGIVEIVRQPRSRGWRALAVGLGLLGMLAVTVGLLTILHPGT